MTGLDLHWFLPINGDSRQLVGGGHGVGTGAAGPLRQASLDYLATVAQAAEQVGFTGALTPTGAWCEDAWLTTAMLVAHTRRLKFLVAFRPGILSPTLAAQQAATYQRHSGGKLLLNVVTGGESREQRAYGDFLDKDARYRRTAEFLHVVPSTPTSYLTWGEPPAQVAEKIAWIRGLAAEHGRTLRFGIRLHVITRDTSAAAWAHAQSLLAAIDPAVIATVQAGLAASESEGQRRMRALHNGTTTDLEIAPNLWAGVGLVRGGAGTALVGSHEEVADRIVEYHALGIDEFILSGYPHLEEAWCFGEGVLPILRRRGLWASPDTADAQRSRTADYAAMHTL